MLESENTTLKLDPSHRLLMPSVIAVVAVTTVFLLFSSSAFLVAALGICLTLTLVFRFEWFLYGQIFLLPWYPFLSNSFLLHDVSLRLRFLTLVGVWMIRKQEGKSVSEWFAGNRIKKGVLAFAGIATVSLLVSTLGPNQDALISLIRLFSYLALFFAVSGWLTTREQIEKIVKVILFSGIVVALFGFCQVWANGYTDLYHYLYPVQDEGLEDWNGRITSFLFHFNSLAGYLNLVLPLALACTILAKNSRVQQLAFASYSMGLAALYFTGSRGGLIAYGVMLLVSIPFMQPWRFALRQVLLATTVAAIIVVVLRLPSQSENASASRLQQLDEFTVVSRLALWGAAGAMFSQRPILGVGYGNYRSFYNDYIPGIAPNQLDAHNIYLQLLSETGALGFLTFCLLMVAFARVAIELARTSDPLPQLIGIAVGGALVSTLTHGMVDYLFNVSPQFGALFWATMALGVAVSQQSLKTSTGIHPQLVPLQVAGARLEASE